MSCNFLYRTWFRCNSLVATDQKHRQVYCKQVSPSIAIWPIISFKVFSNMFQKYRDYWSQLCRTMFPKDADNLYDNRSMYPYYIHRFRPIIAMNASCMRHAWTSSHATRREKKGKARHSFWRVDKVLGTLGKQLLCASNAWENNREAERRSPMDD